MARAFITQVSRSLPFDNTSNGFVADNAQEAIEEIQNNSSDHHAGWYLIDTEVVIQDKKQSRISGVLTLNGILVINGSQVID